MMNGGENRTKEKKRSSGFGKFVPGGEGRKSNTPCQAGKFKKKRAVKSPKNPMNSPLEAGMHKSKRRRDNYTPRLERTYQD